MLSTETLKKPFKDVFILVFLTEKLYFLESKSIAVLLIESKLFSNSSNAFLLSSFKVLSGINALLSRLISKVLNSNDVAPVFLSFSSISEAVVARLSATSTISEDTETSLSKYLIVSLRGSKT